MTSVWSPACQDTSKAGCCRNWAGFVSKGTLFPCPLLLPLNSDSDGTWTGFARAFCPQVLAELPGFFEFYDFQVASQATGTICSHWVTFPICLV